MFTNYKSKIPDQLRAVNDMPQHPAMVDRTANQRFNFNSREPFNALNPRPPTQARPASSFSDRSRTTVVGSRISSVPSYPNHSPPPAYNDSMYTESIYSQDSHQADPSELERELQMMRSECSKTIGRTYERSGGNATDVKLRVAYLEGRVTWLQDMLVKFIEAIQQMEKQIKESELMR